MDKKIISLCDAGESRPLCQFLEEVEHSQISKLIDQRALRGKGDVVAFVRAVLIGSSSATDVGVKRRLHVYKHCISLLQSSELQSKVASELVGLLMLEADNFPGQCLAELAKIYVDSVKNGVTYNGKALELFPKILSALESRDAVSFGGNEMKGSEYKSHVLNSLCAGRWDAQSVVPLATMFKDIPMTSEELMFVIHKILRMFKDLDLQELPPLVYQLLLLSTKGHKKLVLEGVSQFFIEREKQYRKQTHDHSDDDLSEMSSSNEQLPHVEGTIILHVTFAIKQDQDLGREFVKCLKVGQQSSLKQVLAPFNIALALSIARMHRFEDQIFDFLKSSILRSFKDCEKQRDSFWVREMVPETCEVTEQVLDTVKNSSHGWDHVTQGLVQLGFSLMDSFGPKSAFGKVKDVVPTFPQTPTQRAGSLGAKILLETFKVHDMVRAEILEQILNRIVTKATAPVSHYLDLLAGTIAFAPQALLDSQAKVREAFDYLSFLPQSTALGLIRSVYPLLKISLSLKDSLILVLRKALFSRQIEARKIAVDGFLMILRHFKVLGGMPSSQCSQSFSLSQIQVDVHVRHNPASNEALCLEILGNLRRCLTQQADVRLTLYQGLYEALCRNSQLSEPILGMLSVQLKQYYESAEDVNPPLKLNTCVYAQAEQVFNAEPLAHLLSCIVQCMIKLKMPTSEVDTEEDPPEDATNIGPQLENMLDSLVRRMIKSELEDFELDRSADFSMATSVGMKNNIFAILVCGIYEVLMEYTFLMGSYEVSACQEVVQLYQKLQQLLTILGEKSGGGTGAGKKARTSVKADPKHKSMLSVRFVTAILKALFSDSTPDHQESLQVLRQNTDFTRYIVSTALQKLQQVNEKGSCDGPEGHLTVKLFKYICSISRVLLKEYTLDLHTADENKKERSKQQALLCLDAFHTAVNIVCCRYTSQLDEFLTSLDKQRTSDIGVDVEDHEQRHANIKKFQRMVVGILSSDGDERSPKEAVLILNVIGQLSRQLKPESTESVQVQGWVQRLCTEQAVDDTAACKMLLSLLFSLTVRQKTCSLLIKDIARDIHSRLGDIDQEVEIEESSNLAVINIRTAAPTVFLLVLAQIDRELDDTEWVINRLKANMAAPVEIGAGDNLPGPTQRVNHEKTICAKLGHMVHSFHELVQAALPVGPCVETMLKVLTRFFGTLTLLAKFHVTMYQQKCGHISGRFEKLVKASGVHMTHYVYAMITYIQATQNERFQQVAGGKKKDKKKQDAVAQASRNQALKEAKSIPNLIFAIEQYERFLIQLSKLSKINLMDHFKMSTSRDFRINANALQAALAEQEEDSSSDSSDDEAQQRESGSDNENQEPASKKAKKT